MLSESARNKIDTMLKLDMKKVFRDADVLDGIIAQAAKADGWAYELPANIYEAAEVSEVRLADGSRCFAFRPKGAQAADAAEADAAVQNPELVFLYFHGGGFVMEADQPNLQFPLRMVTELGATALLPVYPLAFSKPIQAVYDCVNAAFDYALSLNPGKLVVGGDSAGGNLAVSACQLANQRGVRQADYLIAISPWLDADGTLPGKSMVEPGDPMLSNYGLTRIMVEWGGDAVLNHEFPPCPLYGPMKDMPSTLVTYGTAEILQFDALRLIELLRFHGVPVEVMVGEGLWHVFPIAIGVDESTEAAQAIVEKVRQLL